MKLKRNVLNKKRKIFKIFLSINTNNSNSYSGLLRSNKNKFVLLRNKLNILKRLIN